MEQQKPTRIGGFKGKFEIIKRTVLEYYDLEWEEVQKPGRKPVNVLARAMIYYFTKNLTTATLVWIGEQFSSSEFNAKGLDHTTVMHGIKKVNDWLSYDKSFQGEFSQIKDKIYSHPVFND